MPGLTALQDAAERIQALAPELLQFSSGSRIGDFGVLNGDAALRRPLLRESDDDDGEFARRFRTGRNLDFNGVPGLKPRRHSDMDADFPGGKCSVRGPSNTRKDAAQRS